ncbi:AI-2E family transporter [Pararobbsia silviterrae]|uniref:AI-2E family transporter n=1 Tax=Pararobbsia silviterrae TaxID=1792498 RepID=A0A494Y9L9_9BURK|nr:AI-2E family transporter [Pararobbsia silviterrae]
MATVIIVCALYFGRTVLIPITLAILLSFLLAPLVDGLRSIGLGRIPAVISAIVFALLVVLGVGGLIGVQVAQLASSLPRYQATIEDKIETVQEKTLGRADDLLTRAAHALKESGQHVQDSTTPGPNDADTDVRPLPVEVHERHASPLELAQRYLSPVFDPLATSGIVLVVAIFILIQRGDLRDRLIRLVGSSDLHRTTTALDEAARRLSRYFVAQLSMNAGVGLVIALGLVVMGVPGALLFGVLAALLRFVPYVGSWLAAAAAAILAAAVQPNWTLFVWTIVLFGFIEILASQVIEPVLYGHSSGLSPFAVIVAAIFWSWIWGPIGLILSTPLTLCLVILGRHVDRLQFLEVLFGDRPALTPDENFYQRILAGDPDEALAQAEVLLRENALTAYYDEVSIKGLRLAYNDMARGVVTETQLRRIKQATRDLIEGLEDVADRSAHVTQAGEGPAIGDLLPERLEGAPRAAPASVPEHTAARRAVLCISGRGELDELMVSIAMQLLRKHGLDVTHVASDTLPRDSQAVEQVVRAEVICILSFDAEYLPFYLRYLTRRIEQRVPDATVVFGLGRDWAPSMPKASGPLADLGNANLVATLRELIEACVLAAQLGPGERLPVRPRDADPEADGERDAERDAAAGAASATAHATSH